MVLGRLWRIMWWTWASEWRTACIAVFAFNAVLHSEFNTWVKLHPPPSLLSGVCHSRLALWSSMNNAREAGRNFLFFSFCFPPITFPSPPNIDLFLILICGWQWGGGERLWQKYLSFSFCNNSLPGRCSLFISDYKSIRRSRKTSQPGFPSLESYRCQHAWMQCVRQNLLFEADSGRFEFLKKIYKKISSKVSAALSSNTGFGK